MAYEQLKTGFCALKMWYMPGTLRPPVPGTLESMTLVYAGVSIHSKTVKMRRHLLINNVLRRKMPNNFSICSIQLIKRIEVSYLLFS